MGMLVFEVRVWTKFEDKKKKKYSGILRSLQMVTEVFISAVH